MIPPFIKLKLTLAAYDRGDIDLVELNRKLREHEENNDRSARPSRRPTQTLVLWSEP